MRRLLIVLRVLLFLPVLYFLSRKINFELLVYGLKKANLGYLLMAGILYVTKYVIQGLRWYNATLAYRLYFPARSFVKRQIEIAFLEMVLPFPDSEDLIRVIMLRRLSMDTAKSTAIAFFDRILGTQFILILLPFSGWLMADAILRRVNISYVWCIVLSFCLFICTLFYRKIILIFLNIIRRLDFSDNRFFRDLNNSLSDSIRSRYQLYGSAAVAMYGFSGTLCIWLITLSLGINVPILQLFLCIPAFYISQTLPLSYQGLGLYEATMIYILEQMGVNKEMALICGTIHFLFHVLMILSGGTIFLGKPSLSIKSILGSKSKIMNRLKKM